MSSLKILQNLKRQHLLYFLRNQRTFIVVDVHKPTQLLNYTYLQSNLPNVPFLLHSKLQTLQFQPKTIRTLQKYADSVQKNGALFQYICSEQMGPNILDNSQLQKLSHLFKQVKSCINQQVTNAFHSRNIKPQQLCLLARGLNILQFNIWNKLIMYGCQQHKNLSIPSQNLFIQTIQSYLNKYSYIGTNTMRFKFIMRQTHLQDIVDFGYFFSSTQNSKLLSYNFNENNNNIMFGTLQFANTPQYQKFQMQLNIFRNRMRLINKISKGVNVNYYIIRDQFQKMVPNIIHHMDYLNLQDLIRIYYFYVKLSITQNQILQKLQNFILSRLLTKQLTNDNQSLHIIKHITTAWKLQSRFNHDIYYEIILPFLEKQIRLCQESNMVLAFNTWNQIAHSLICCGLAKSQLTMKILQLLGEHKYTASINRTYKISTQYLKLLKLKEEGKDLKHLLEGQLNKLATEERQIQAIQYNPIQKFWFSIIKNALSIQNVFKSQYVSEFQIDILVLYKGYYFAFEIQGGHYKKKEGNMDVFVGKKKIKKEILEAFGITTISLHCEETVPKTIMRFNKTKDAKKLILSLLEQNVQMIEEKKKIKQKNKGVGPNDQKDKKIDMIV